MASSFFFRIFILKPVSAHGRNFLYSLKHVVAFLAVGSYDQLAHHSVLVYQHSRRRLLHHEHLPKRSVAGYLREPEVLPLYDVFYFFKRIIRNSQKVYIRTFVFPFAYLGHFSYARPAARIPEVEHQRAAFG